jgi:hypothetical protein
MKRILMSVIGIAVLIGVLVFAYLYLSPSQADIPQQQEPNPQKEVVEKLSDTEISEVITPDENEPVNDDEDATTNDDESLEEPALDAEINTKEIKEPDTQETNEGSVVEPPAESGIVLSSWMLVTVAGFFVMLACLLTTTILLLREVRWRKRHNKNEWIVFPDAHIDVLEKLEAAWKALHDQLQQFGSLSIQVQKENESLSIKTIDSIAKFNSTIDSQQAEIDRLKEGYDFSIKKHSISALLEINDLVSNILNEELAEETKERITKIDAYIQSNLEELDVEDFKLDAGISIRDLAPDEFEIESSEAVDDADLHEKIKTTTKAGYAFVHSNGRNVIRKAKITVYKKEVQDG